MAVGLLAAPLAAHAQQTRKVNRIGLLLTSPDGETGFLAALRNLGYVEGQNVLIERRYMADRKEGLSVLATELVQLNPDIIVVVNGYQAAAVRESTKTVPIVTMAAGDLVAEGLVANLAKPGGNITGSQVMQPDTAAKRVALLKDTIPSISRIALLFGPVGQWFYDSVSRETRAASETLRRRFRFSRSGPRPNSTTVLPRCRRNAFKPRLSQAISSPSFTAVTWRISACSTDCRPCVTPDLGQTLETSCPMEQTCSS
jgi:putative ABC transport system substrate-binding protein